MRCMGLRSLTLWAHSAAEKQLTNIPTISWLIDPAPFRAPHATGSGAGNVTMRGLMLTAPARHDESPPHAH